MIRFNTVVRHVRYTDETNEFSVTVENLEKDKGETTTEIFSHCIVATGIYSFPNTPSFPGIESFEGRILHSHDFRNGKEFKGQSVLIIGSSLSADDIAMHCINNGADHVIVSWRSKSPNHKWPQGIEERPLVERLESGKAFFKDKTEAEIDTIIMCTGYKSYFPFMESRLRISSDGSLYPAGLYKGALFIDKARNKLFYTGVQKQFFSIAMFDSLAVWICKYIMGKLKDEPKSKEAMEADCKVWRDRASTVSDPRGVVDFATLMLTDLTEQTGYQKDITSMSAIMYDWIKHRKEGIADYRKNNFRSLYSST